MTIGYDAAGRPNSVTSAEGTHGITYSATTGQVTALTALHGVGQTLTYNGALPPATTWTGPVAGTVEFSYDNALRLSGVTVNGNAISGPSYSPDGLPGFQAFGYAGGHPLLSAKVLMTG